MRKLAVLSAALAVIMTAGCTVSESPAEPGATGSQGPAGATGDPGPPGPKGMNWRGNWSALETYVPDDAIVFLGESYIAVSTVVAVEPPMASAWQLFAARGAAGAAGPAGADGAQGPPGPRGDVGPEGPRGTPLRIVDANGALVGTHLGSNGDEYYTVLTGGRVWRLSLLGAYRWETRSGTAVYASYDCSGTPYLWTADPQWVVQLPHDPANVYAGAMTPVDLTIGSHGAPGACTPGSPPSGSSAWRVYDAVNLGPPPALPALPLHVE